LIVKEVFAGHGLTLFDVERLPSHGGSLRIFVAHSADDTKTVIARVRDLVALEERSGLRQLTTYQDFAERMRKSKRAVVAFLVDAKRAGKRIAGYGAPGKGTRC
jgi:C-methyltransferase C-terminal domain